jgi:hypothetical protein
VLIDHIQNLLVCRWLLLAKLQQQSGNAEGFTSAQNQALELQRTLLEQLRQSGGAATGSSGSSSTSKSRASHGVADLLSGLGGGMAAAVGNVASAKAKAASICFDLAEYYRKHRQFDKVKCGHAAACLCAMCHGNDNNMDIGPTSRDACNICSTAASFMSCSPQAVVYTAVSLICRLRRHTRLA